jgi:hypothetical protein
MLLSPKCLDGIIVIILYMICWMLAQKYFYLWTGWIQIDASNCTMKCMNVSFPHVSLHFLATASLGHWGHWVCWRFAVFISVGGTTIFTVTYMFVISYLVFLYLVTFATICCHLYWCRRACPIFPYRARLFSWTVYFSLKTTETFKGQKLFCSVLFKYFGVCCAVNAVCVSYKNQLLNAV